MYNSMSQNLFCVNCDVRVHNRYRPAFQVDPCSRSSSSHQSSSGSRADWEEEAGAGVSPGGEWRQDERGKETSDRVEIRGGQFALLWMWTIPKSVQLTLSLSSLVPLLLSFLSIYVRHIQPESGRVARHVVLESWVFSVMWNTFGQDSGGRSGCEGVDKPS
jgi:hypothetical protein